MELKESSLLPPKIIAGNKNFTIVRNDAADLFCWGSNQDNTLGLSTGDPYVSCPLKHEYFVANNLKIIDISVGKEHIAVIAESEKNVLDGQGDVYTWGFSNQGRLGLDNLVQDESSFTLTRTKLHFQTN